MWQFDRNQLSQDIICDRASAMLWAMVERDANHPAIWAWSVLNECDTHTSEGRSAVGRFVQTIRELDTTRPVTFASHHGLDDVCHDLADLFCVNAYYGWYLHDLTWEQFLDRVRTRIGDKPMIVTEFGAGALYGWRASEQPVIWSEEYQRDLLAGCIDHFDSRQDLAGYYVWQFCDTRTDKGDDGRRALMRPRYMNNKGLVDEFRRRKLAFGSVRERMRRS